MSDDLADREMQFRTGLRGVLPPGTKLRGYELISTLGQGAFGVTYRAVDATLHREVAIKEYLPTTLALREGRTTVLPRSPDHAQQFAWGRDRFLEEARTLARLERAPGIVRVHDYLEDNGTAYMVMELIEGETLARRLTREQHLVPAAVDRLLYPLLDGLEALHAASFLHCDIKPANIMMDAGGRPTLIDFGASRAAMAERTTMTAIFTPGYAAAEQFIAASKLGPATDIYGLSATLYHAITGEIPPSAIQRIMKDDYQALKTLRLEGCAPALLRGIDRGLSVQADDRPQSIAEWRSILGPPSQGMYSTRMIRRAGRLPRVASRVRHLRLTLKGRALGAVLAAMALFLTGGSYLAWVYLSATATTAALNLSAEQLEQALAERRKADALAEEKRRLAEEARRRAEAEAETDRRAERALQEARLARQNAEAELAQLKADLEARETRRQEQAGVAEPASVAAQRAVENSARLKAEQEAAALREAESQAQRKADAEAQSRRQADEALARAQAEQRQAEEEAQRKAQAEAVKRDADEQARQKAEAAAKEKGDLEAQRKVAEASERALHLEAIDRERLQAALTSLGFDTRGLDGLLGPRSREMIEAWQKARNQPATGFLTAVQQQALLKEAAPAIAKFDDELKQALDEKRPASEAPPRAPAAIPTAMRTAAADGLWRGTYSCGVGAAANAGLVGPAFTLNLAIRLTNGSGLSRQWAGETVNGNTRAVGLSVDAAGAVVLNRTVSNTEATLAGQFAGNSIRAAGTESGRLGRSSCTLAMTRDPEAAPPMPGPYDSTYVGDEGYAGLGRLFIKVNVANGQGRGTMTSPGCNPSPLSLTISPTGDIKGECDFNCIVGGPPQLTGLLRISGRYDGRFLSLNFGNQRGGARMQLWRQPN